MRALSAARIFSTEIDFDSATASFKSKTFCSATAISLFAALSALSFSTSFCASRTATTTADFESITDKRNSATASCAETTLSADSFFAESNAFSAEPRLTYVERAIVVEVVVVVVEVVVELVVEVARGNVDTGASGTIGLNTVVEVVEELEVLEVREVRGATVVVDTRVRGAAVVVVTRIRGATVVVVTVGTTVVVVWGTVVVVGNVVVVVALDGEPPLAAGTVVAGAAVTVAVDVDEAASLPTVSCTAEFDVAEFEVGAVYTTVTMSPIAAAGEIVSTTVEPLIVIELIVFATKPIETPKSPTAAEVA